MTISDRVAGEADLEGSSTRAYFLPRLLLGAGEGLWAGGSVGAWGPSCTGGSLSTFLKNAYGTFAVSTASLLVLMNLQAVESRLHVLVRAAAVHGNLQRLEEREIGIDLCGELLCLGFSLHDNDRAQVNLVQRPRRCDDHTVARQQATPSAGHQQLAMFFAACRPEDARLSRQCCPAAPDCSTG